MNYCSQCGASVQIAIPEGDDRQRTICTRCDTVHYDNPRTVVGCLVEHEGHVLLCRRAIEPREGFWTLPAGYLELEESTIEGAVRETLEEAEATVEVTAPHAQLDIPHIGQSYTLFRARMLEDRYAAGAESLEVRMFPIDELPWDELAFPVIYFALRFFVEDHQRGEWRAHHGAVSWNRRGSRYDWRQCEIRDHLGVALRTDP